ncbi:sugar phosphate isomerase/epimerase family protein [Demequina sp. SO4-18]|uniref:sugar phosphate isomerase/epimerase family protein n=1 Tax=Demequina sp. SO4-18 TaxID=3401026 RepID=UPI003B5B4EBE
MTNHWPIAASTFIWHSPLTTQILEARLPQLADWGFDAVELPLDQVGDWDVERIGVLMAELGLRSAVCTVFSPGRELAAAPAETQANTLDYVRSAIDVAAAQGSGLVIGPTYCSVGRAWPLDVDDRRRVNGELRDNYLRLIDHAGPLGVKLAIEPLNRYESSVFNTTEQVLDVIGDLDPNVIGLGLDTYHMNIEERTFAGALRLAGDRLLHLQVCGSDRGAPGGDHTPWDEVFTTLREIGYAGMLGIESFTAENESMAKAASIWRPLAASQDELAIEGLAFLQQSTGAD